MRWGCGINPGITPLNAARPLAYYPLQGIEVINHYKFITYMSDDQKGSMIATGFFLFVGLLIVGFIAFLMWVMPTYSVWSREMNGKAELAEAEWTKKVAIETAKAKKESAQYEAEAEITRAKGASEAQKIISTTLNENYLRYLWIQTVEKGDNRQTIYIPTEAGLPMLEAGRLGK